MTDKLIVLVTCGSRSEARLIAYTLVEGKLAACGNVVEASVQSIYRWKGRIESAREVLLVIKSSRKRFRALLNTIKRLHSYEVPEIIALPVAAGSPDYLAWLSESIKPSRSRKKARR